MQVTLNRLVLDGKTNEENIAKIDTYINNLVNVLEHAINHLDSTNFAEAPATKQEVHKAINDAYEELRTFTVSRTS